MDSRIIVYGFIAVILFSNPLSVRSQSGSEQQRQAAASDWERAIYAGSPAPRMKRKPPIIIKGTINGWCYKEKDPCRNLRLVDQYARSFRDSNISRPDPIEVKKGETVVIELVNESTEQMTFMLTDAEPIEACTNPIIVSMNTGKPAPPCQDFPSFGVSAAILPGKSLRIAFKADKAGKFKYFDSLHPTGYGLLSVE